MMFESNQLGGGGGVGGVKFTAAPLRVAVVPAGGMLITLRRPFTVTSRPFCRRTSFRAHAGVDGHGDAQRLVAAVGDAVERDGVGAVLKIHDDRGDARGGPGGGKAFDRNDVVLANELQGVGGVGAGDREDAAAQRGDDLVGEVLTDVVELDGAVGGDVEGIAGTGDIEIRATDRLDRLVAGAGHDEHALGQGLIAAVGGAAERDGVVAAAEVDQDAS